MLFLQHELDLARSRVVMILIVITQVEGRIFVRI